MPDTLTATALRLAEHGFSVIPLGGDKRPLGPWKEAQSRIYTPDEIREKFTGAKGIGVVTGAVSGNLYVYDFDPDKDKEALEPFDLEQGFIQPWLDNIAGTADPDTIPRVQTGGGGAHFWLRCDEPVLGNEKLAQVKANNKQGFVTVIETRGEGGYVVVPPSAHPSGAQYAWKHLGYTETPVIASDALKRLSGVAKALNTLDEPDETTERNLTAQHRTGRDPRGDSIIDQYNERMTCTEVLERNGYKRFGRKFLAPDSTSGNPGVYLFRDADMIYSHHGDALGDGKAHDAFDVMALLEHGGNKKAAAVKARRELGIAPGGSSKRGGKPSGKGENVATEEATSEAPGVYVDSGAYWLDKPVQRHKGEVIAWEPYQLTNWIWTPTLSLQWPDGSTGERGTLTINNNERARKLDLPAKVWNGRRELLDAIGPYGAVLFTPSSADVAKIRQSIVLSYPELPSATGVTSYGLHRTEGGWLEVFEDKTLPEQNAPPIFYAGMPVMPGSQAHAAPPKATAEELQRAKNAITHMPHLISAKAALAMLGYAVASAFAPLLTPEFGNRMPFGFFTGERESGKTSFAQLVLELVTGHGRRISKASGISRYQYDIAHSGANNLLALLDEYRPGEIDESQIRKHHDLDTKWRGSGKAAQDYAYILNCPMIMLGEGFSEDAATKSRGVLYFIEKQDRGSIKLYSEILKAPLWAYAEHLHALARLGDTDAHTERLSRADALAAQAMGEATSPRLRYGLIMIAYGLLVLQADVNEKMFSDAAVLQCLREGVKGTLEGGSESMTNFEMFLQQLGPALTEHRDPASVLAPGLNDSGLIIRISGAVKAVNRSYGSEAAITNAKLVRRYANNLPYVDDGLMHRDEGNNVIRGIKVNLKEVPERCDASALVYLEERLRAS